MCMSATEEGRVEELQQLVQSGAVRSLKVVDTDGCHVLNLAIQNKQDKVVQVRQHRGLQTVWLVLLCTRTPIRV